MADIKHLIEKFWKGELDQQEIHNLEQLLSDTEPQLRQVLEKDYQAMLESGTAPVKLSSLSSSRILQSLHQRIQPATRSVRKVRMYAALKWAACFILLFLAFLFALYSPQKKQPVQQLAVQQAPEEKNYLNHQKKDIRIVLPDASVVILSPESSLRYLADFGLKDRKVYLEGKADFKVAKDQRRPFSVYASRIITTALGTRFTVNTFIKDHVEVKLKEGRVVVHTEGKWAALMKKTYLKPGDQLHVDQLSGQLSLHHKNPAVARPQVQQPPRANLDFKQESLVLVLQGLEKHYQKTIRFSPADLNGLSFTGSIRPSDSLHEIMAIICGMNGLEFTEQGNTIIIKKPEK